MKIEAVIRIGAKIVMTRQKICLDDDDKIGRIEKGLHRAPVLKRLWLNDSIIRIQNFPNE
jgi:hypothetical protein